MSTRRSTPFSLGGWAAHGREGHANLSSSASHPIQFEANNKIRTSLDKANNHSHHRGGEEVLLDVGGQDATEAFEDVGHSDEAREILEGLLVGTLKRGVCPLPAVPFLNNCTIVESGPITEELYSYPENSTFPDSSNQVAYRLLKCFRLDGSEADNME